MQQYNKTVQKCLTKEDIKEHNPIWPETPIHTEYYQMDALDLEKQMHCLI